MLFIHHRVRNYFEDAVVTASATGRAMRRFLNVGENVEEVFDLGVLIEGVEYIEVGYVFAVADLEILCGLGIDGLECAGVILGHCKFLRVCFC